MLYSIKEASKILEVSTVSLRHWERQGFIPKPYRTPTNLRRYSEDDIRAIMGFLKARFGEHNAPN